MTAERRRIAVIVVGLTVAVAGVIAALWSGTRPAETFTRVSLAEHAAREAVVSPGVDVGQPEQGTFIRSPLPFEIESHEVPVPLDVELWGILDLIGPDESGKDLYTFHETDWGRSSEGIVTLTIGETNGFGGAASRVLLDARAKSALVSAWTFGDVGPRFERYWHELAGHVRINNWNLDADTRVEVDVSGELEGEKWSLHLCRALRDEHR